MLVWYGVGNPRDRVSERALSLVNRWTWWTPVHLCICPTFSAVCEYRYQYGNDALFSSRSFQFQPWNFKSI